MTEAAAAPAAPEPTTPTPPPAPSGEAGGDVPAGDGGATAASQPGRAPRRGKRSGRKEHTPKSHFASELERAL